jgi:exosortase/archaeosortase
MEGVQCNLDVTSPAAAMAIILTFMKTGDTVRVMLSCCVVSGISVLNLLVCTVPISCRFGHGGLTEKFLLFVFIFSKFQEALEMLQLPDSRLRLDAVRPDMCLLRAVGVALIKWDSIQPTTDWIVGELTPHLRTPIALARQQGQLLVT